MRFLVIALLSFCSVHAQVSETVTRTLNAEPFNCQAFQESVSGAQGHRLLASAEGEQIIARFTERADEQCLRTFMHNYAWAVGIYGEDGTHRIPDPPSRRETPAPRPRQSCLPWWLRFGRPCENPPEEARAERPRAPQSRAQAAMARRDQTTRNIRRMMAAYLGPRYGATFTLADGRNLMCMPYGQTLATVETVINDFQSSNNELFSCMQPRVGQTKLVSYINGASPTTTGFHYGLRPNRDGSHDVILGLNFTALESATTSAGEMMERTRGCLAEASPMLRGPRGERLNFQILDQQQLAALAPYERPRLNNINVVSNVSRSNSSHYASNVNCATITHEVLHLLGLCDEYRDVEPGYKGECRVVPDVNTIMHDEQEAYQDSAGETLSCYCNPGCQEAMRAGNERRREFYMAPRLDDVISGREMGLYCRSPWDVVMPELALPRGNQSYPASMEVVADELFRIEVVQRIDMMESIGQRNFTCDCTGTQDLAGCQRTLQRIRNAVANPASTMQRGCPNGLEPNSRNLGDHNNGQTTVDGLILTVYNPPRARSLLTPMHYNRILGGFCPTVTPQYNECASWAYIDYKESNNCEGRPARCSDASYYLGVD
jgi:hypothetical protein